MILATKVLKLSDLLPPHDQREEVLGLYQEGGKFYIAFQPDVGKTYVNQNYVNKHWKENKEVTWLQ